MKVISVCPIESVIVITDEIHPNHYTRYSADNWMVSYGMSDEYVSYTDDLEAAYQKFLVDSVA